MKRMNKTIYIIFVFIGLFCISVGYAAINRTLNITGNSEVKENTWDIHFDNLQVSTGSVDAIKEPFLDNNNLSIDFGVYLDLPGDFYEFTVDVVNAGSIDAMIDSIIKTPDLTDEQKKYINYVIAYQGGDEISSKQILFKDDYVRIKVRVDYRKDITENDLPIVDQNLELSFNLNYVQANNTGSVVTNHGIIGVDGALDEIGTIVTIGTEKFYVYGTVGNNVKLLSMYNLYVGNECISASSCSPYGDAATGMQSPKMNSDSTLRQGTTVFSSNEQKGTNYSDYEGSIVEEYVNNYHNLLEERFEIDVIEARLISKEELEDTFGCVKWLYCSTEYPWIYLTNYWTGTAYNDIWIWTINNKGQSGSNVYNHTYFGVRPVIIMSKNDLLGLPKQLIEIIIDDVVYQAEEGMTWEEWINSEYNLIEAVKETENYSSSRILRAYLCELLTSVETKETILANDVIDTTQSYYFKSVGSCK